ncbi:tetratricopeptide repeat protein [Sphingobacterium sp. HJSM2_6]|uniref:tetratricopeptide repeat protein n=1 Tax=Sphingobacterium sp. HJSM2_6 TaxID=3366264 RepID=UPI003BC27F6A
MESCRIVRVDITSILPVCIIRLAVCYKKGKGVEKNDKYAFSLYLKSVLLGDKEAIYEIARMLCYGIWGHENRILTQDCIDLADYLKVKNLMVFYRECNCLNDYIILQIQ